MDITSIFRGNRLIDLAIDVPDLQQGLALETAVTISLFTDRRADNDDEPDLQNRRGWWGDTFLPDQEDKIGSKLWLLNREKQTQDTLNRAQQYCEEALQWLIDDEIAISVEVTNEWIRRHIMGVLVIITKPEGVERFQYEYVWEQLA